MVAVVGWTREYYTGFGGTGSRRQYSQNYNSNTENTVKFGRQNLGGLGRTWQELITFLCMKVLRQDLAILGENWQYFT